MTEPAYLVGGALRDAALGRSVTDIDLAVASARPAAARLARAFKGPLVALDEANDVYRVIIGEGRHIDVGRLQGPEIGSDLARRDFTINAMALPLRPDLARTPAPASVLDPFSGLDDLSRRRLRITSSRVFAQDPLRMLRAFRIAAQLGFTIDSAALAAIRRHRGLITRASGERVAAEILALAALPGCTDWFALMDRAGLLTAVFPELEPARRCASAYYGKGGVLRHSLDVVGRADFLLTNLSRAFPRLGETLRRRLESLSTKLPHRAVLILAALLHDVAKPPHRRETRRPPALFRP